MPVIPFLVCLGLFLLFPKGFKYMVGSFLGTMVGILVWSIAQAACNELFTMNCFIGFIIAGNVGGWITAAKG